jgi:2-keto-4-pentenoate hydratase/2-oxohepta-3-ene-1,7-dioic acid hydratase in catechol pathway
MVYSGKIYETDGANPVAVHEAEAIRPLAPIPHAPSLRFFRTDLQPESYSESEPEEPRFFYGNPVSLVGASQLINFPDSTIALGFEAFVAAVLVGDAYQIDIQDADDLILGITLLNVLVARDRERIERRNGAIGSSHDVGGAIGPVLTTPDELEDYVTDAAFGKRYALSTVVRVNGVERLRGNLELLPFTFAQAISSASQTCTLKAGDVIALGPVVDPELEPLLLDPGDEVQLAVENLGAISLKLSLLQ